MQVTSEGPPKVGSTMPSILIKWLPDYGYAEDLVVHADDLTLPKLKTEERRDGRTIGFFYSQVGMVLIGG